MHWQGLMALSAQLTLRKVRGPVDPGEEPQFRPPEQARLTVPVKEIPGHLQVWM